MPFSRPQTPASKKLGQAANPASGVPERPTFLQRLSALLPRPSKLRRAKSTPNIPTAPNPKQPSVRAGNPKAPLRHTQHPPNIELPTAVAAGSYDPTTYYSFPAFQKNSQTSLLSSLCLPPLRSGAATPSTRSATSKDSIRTQASRGSLRSVFSCPAAFPPTTSPSRPKSAGKDYLAPESRLHGAAHHHLHRPHGLHTIGGYSGPSSPTSLRGSRDSATPRPTSAGSNASRTYESTVHYPPYRSSSPRPLLADYSRTTRNSFLTDGPGTRLPLVQSANPLVSVDSVTAFGEITKPDLVGELPRIQLRRKPRFFPDKHDRPEGYPKVVIGERSRRDSIDSVISESSGRPGQESRPQSASSDTKAQSSANGRGSQDAVPRLRGGAGSPDGRVPRLLWFTAGGMGRRPMMGDIRLTDQQRAGIFGNGLMGLLIDDSVRRARSTTVTSTSTAAKSNEAAPTETNKGEAADEAKKEAEPSVNGNAEADAAAPAPPLEGANDQNAVSGALPAP